MDRKVLVLASVIALNSGCSMRNAHVVPGDPNFAPVAPEQLIPATQVNGSLYREGFGLSLYNDNTARRVGDLLTVKFSESVTSATGNSASTDRNTSINIPNPTLFGGQPAAAIPILKALLGQDKQTLEQGISTGDNKYEGSGSSSESHSLNQGYITVTVTQVMPNGNLKVRGEKWVNLNEDNKFVRLTGIVRPADISASNEIVSNKIADARIYYGGKGAIANSSKPGWLASFLISPLYPF